MGTSATPHTAVGQSPAVGGAPGGVRMRPPKHPPRCSGPPDPGSLQAAWSDCYRWIAHLAERQHLFLPTDLTCAALCSWPFLQPAFEKADMQHVRRTVAAEVKRGLSCGSRKYSLQRLRSSAVSGHADLSKSLWRRTHCPKTLNPTRPGCGLLEQSTRQHMPRH